MHGMRLGINALRMATSLVAAAALAAACSGSGARESGAGTPGAGTPGAGTPQANATAPTDLSPPPFTPPAFGTPVECVPVEPQTFESEKSLADRVPEGKIAFVSFRDDYKGQANREIYVLTPDSSTPVNLTRNSCADDEPDWAPDGRKIAWESDRDGDFEIYTMNADGSDVAQLTHDGGAVAARWSRDGKLIAYSRGGTIMVMNADGSNPHAVLIAASESDELCKTGGFPGGWSPDSTRIIYYAASAIQQVGHVCIVSLDGSVETVVSQPPGYNVEPVWSPDGKRVAFRAIRDGNHDIYVYDLESKTEQRLTDVPALDSEPDWSPDGEWIVFGSNRDSGLSTDIYIMRSDGSDVRRLTDHPAKDSYPVWSP
ncbi:MAG TPA: hypothetical protein VFT91_06375 [Dehalococcoidia bacterium]|nr:hypothetical protein [Dehalococcoidia bacterium]